MSRLQPALWLPESPEGYTPALVSRLQPVLCLPESPEGYTPALVFQLQPALCLPKSPEGYTPALVSRLQLALFYGDPPAVPQGRNGAAMVCKTVVTNAPTIPVSAAGALGKLGLSEL